MPAKSPEEFHSTLSVVVPCFNEAATIVTILDRVFSIPLVGEVIVVDDGSADTTVDLVKGYKNPRLRLFEQSTNQGKGAALRRGLALATLPFVIIQDADLEYDPNDYAQVLQPIFDGDADVVFGSRFRGGQAQRVLYFWHTVGNRVLTLASNMTTNLNLTDMETCYKAFRREIIQSIEIEEDRFGFEPEITAKVAALKCRVFEVGISYHGRTYAEGKKIGVRDGIRAIYCILAFSAPGKRFGVRRLGPLVTRLTKA